MRGRLFICKLMRKGCHIAGLVQLTVSFHSANASVPRARRAEEGSTTYKIDVRSLGELLLGLLASGTIYAVGSSAHC
jgi:hypothetical protein